MAIGIAAIVALLSITQGLQASVQEQLRDGLGYDTLTVTAKSGGRPSLTSDISTIEALDRVTCAALNQRPGISAMRNDTVEVSIGVWIWTGTGPSTAACSSPSRAPYRRTPQRRRHRGAKVIDPGLERHVVRADRGQVTVTSSAAGSRPSAIHTTPPSGARSAP